MADATPDYSRVIIPKPPSAALKALVDDNWRQVVGFPGYRVSREGKVQTCWTRRALGGKRGTAVVMGHLWNDLEIFEDYYGYQKVSLVSNSHKKTCKIHQLVAEAFIGPCPEGMEVRHLNSIPSDNRLDNLEYGTKSQNALDKRKSRGDAVSLTDAQKEEIKKLYAGGLSFTAIAKIFNCSDFAIRSVFRKIRKSKNERDLERN